MKRLERVYCRAFQGVFRAALPFMPYREPKNLHSIVQIPDVLQERNISKVLLVTDESIRGLGLTKHLEVELRRRSIFCAVYDKVVANPTIQNIEQARAVYLKSGAQAMIAFGGGSVMDCAKCIALMAANPGDIWDYSLSKNGGKKPVAFDAIPIVCITTSAGTGSEVDIAADNSDAAGQEKTGNFFPSMFTPLSNVDADLMMSVPPVFTAYQGMDAFFHASESGINKNEHPMGEMFALKAIELIAKYLPLA